MMKRAIFGACLAALTMTLPAVAATTTRYQVKGETASANFYKSDDCGGTYVYVFGGNNVSKSAPGSPTAQQHTDIYYSNYNYCTGTSSFLYGSSSNATLKIDNSLNSATLTGTFTVDDGSGATKQVDVNLSWAGTGETYRGNSHYNYQGPGYRSSSRYVGSSRNAQVTGTITANGTSLIANLSSEGYLNSSNSGSMESTRK